MKHSDHLKCIAFIYLCFILRNSNYLPPNNTIRHLGNNEWERVRKKAIVVYYCGIFLEILRKTGRVQLGQSVSELKFELRTSKILNITDIIF
jgi:hypothetical protein